MHCYIEIEYAKIFCVESPPPKPFGQAVAEVFRGVSKSVKENESIDRSVKEQVTKELDGLAEKHEGKKTWPVSSLE